MSKIRIISSTDIEKILTLPMAIKAVERAYLQKSSGAGQVWPMVFHEFEAGHSDLDIKSGNLNEEDIFGLKVVSWYGANPEKQLPALFGTSLVFDLKTGEPKALLNAGAITDFRTGAAGAVGAKYLAKKDSKNLLMVGCGALAPYMIAATLITMPAIERVTLVNPKTPQSAVSKLDIIIGKINLLLEKSNVVSQAVIVAETDIESAVRGSDIILTATPSYQPMIQSDWIKPGTHFSCIGSDMSGKQEIASEIFSNARVFGDDIQQCLSVGECEIPYKEGKIDKLTGEIGDVILEKILGRTSPDDITIFDSTGIALQDLASAATIIEEAKKADLGVVVEL